MWFFMYKNKVRIQKIEVVPPIPDYIIPMDFCQNYSSVINFKTCYMTSKFGLFSKNKMNNIYITESMQTDWLHMIYEYWE